MKAYFQLAFYEATKSNTIKLIDENDHLWGTAVKHILRIAGVLSSAKGKKGNCIIQILFVNKHNLTSTSFLQNLCSTQNNGGICLRPVFSNTPNSDIDYRPMPVITIGPVQVMDIYEDAPPLDFEFPEKDINSKSRVKTWQDSRIAKKWLYNMGLDHRIKFLDSGIWHRYIPYDSDFDKDFPDLLRTIADYHHQKLYISLASLASLEFQCRMLQQSFINKFGNQGHSEAVTPFKFHSETMTTRKIDIFVEFLKKEGLNNIKWNILLVDDYADREISTNLSDKEKKAIEAGNDTKIPNKSMLVKQILESCKIQHVLKYTSDANRVISSGIDILQSKELTIDLILLDYLLGDSEFMPNHKAYGHEFLLEMTQRECNRGPLGRFWIVLTSTFPFAFIDKLRQLSMDGSSERWYIANGSDPITTPELYKLGILRVVLRQISECYLFDASLMRKIDRFDGVNEIGQWCNALINQIRQLKETRNMLEGDRERHSQFAETMEEFLDEHKIYLPLLGYLEDWLRYFSFYKKGKPFKNYYYNLDKIRDKYPDYPDLINIIQHLKDKSHKFVIDAVEDMRDQINLIKSTRISISEMIKHAKSNPVSRNGFLYEFPEFNSSEEVAHVTHLDLSNQKLKSIPISISKFKNLQELDLSNNPELAYLPVPEMLSENKKLTILNLTETRIGNEILGKYPASSDKKIGVRKILKYIHENYYIEPGWLKNAEGDSTAIKIFICYAHADEDPLEKLITHLDPLKRQGVEFWYDKQILPGGNRDVEIEAKIKQADYILLILSPDFISSKVSISEYDIIRERYSKGGTVIPVYLRNCDTTEIKEHFQSVWLPTNDEKKPVMSFTNTDEALELVAKGLRRAIDHRRSSSK